MKKLFFTIMAVTAISLSASANWKLDQLALRCHTADGAGPLSPHAITMRILGLVQDSGQSYPDLIVELDNWYPGAAYYKYVRHDEKGTPVFQYDSSLQLPYNKWKEGGNTTCAVQDGDNVSLFWYTIDTLNVASFNPKSKTFEKVAKVPFHKMQYKPKAMYVEKLGAYGYRIWYGAQDRWSKKVPGHHRKGDYFPYDGAGVWRGGFTYMGLYSFDIDENFNAVNEPEMVSKRPDDILHSYMSISPVLYSQKIYGMLTGSYMGGLYFYKRKGQGINAEDKKYIVGQDGVALRHPGILATPISYPSQDGSLSDIIATCEGGVYFYKYSGQFTQSGNPIYETPVSLLETDPVLYGGTLPVPSVADWDGDGKLDIISGNSQGFIQFFKNIGDNAEPKFTSPVNLKACGHTIQIQSGYGEDIQGPLEARYGYVCPNVVDWNDDGKLDIMFSDARGKHMILLGKEGLPEDRLDLEHPIYCNDLDLHGTWRCRPGIAKTKNKTLYITLDDNNELHLYSKIDTYNLQDEGKLLLKDGKTIPASTAQSGGTGRLKIDITDWDGDGKLDLILGTCKHHSIPGHNGLPEKYHSKGLKTLREDKDTYVPYTQKDIKLLGPVYHGSSPEYNAASFVLFMKNVGKNDAPVYEYPEIIRYEGEKIKLGQHAVGVTATMLGNTDGKNPNLLVADERGRFYLIEREKLNW